MKINLNNYITVYPTEQGWEVIKQYYLDLDSKRGLDFLESYKTEDEGYRTQMWMFIEEFGKHINLGSNFLKTTDLIYEE